MKLNKMTRENIQHSLILDDNPELPRFYDGSIDYPSGNKLVFFEDTNRDASNCRKYYVFDYHSNGDIIRLNDLVANMNAVFIPVHSKFCIRLSDFNYGTRQFPEIQLNIPQLNNETKILAALHEIGHENQYAVYLNYLIRLKNGESSEDTLSKLELSAVKSQPDLPDARDVSLRGSYTEKLIATHRFFKKLFGFDDYIRLTERFAWAFAFNTMRNLKLLEGIQKSELRKYCRSCLKNHGEHCI